MPNKRFATFLQGVGDERRRISHFVKNYGRALYFASDRLKDDHGIVMEAVKQNGHAIEYASDRLIGESWFIAKVIQSCDDLFEHWILSDGKEAFGAFCSRCLSLNFLSHLRTALDIIRDAKGIGGMEISFLEQEGRPAAQHCIVLCRSYFSERIWLLGKVFPKDVVKTIDAMSDWDFSGGLCGMSTLLECAPVISALEHRNLSWTTLSNLDCICNLDEYLRDDNDE